jgi:hypothetical protein
MERRFSRRSMGDPLALLGWVDQHELRLAKASTAKPSATTGSAAAMAPAPDLLRKMTHSRRRPMSEPPR